MAKLLKGKPVADAIFSDLSSRVQNCKDKGIIPTLAIIRVGDREDDISYERSAITKCESIGINVKQFVLSDDCSQQDLLDTIDVINEDEHIHGCIIFRPLPKQLDETQACSRLDFAKDVDGMTHDSLYGVFSNTSFGFAPCTAEACLEMLKFYGYDLRGANVVVLGRSLVIGKPVSMMLQAEDATVTMCHTKTRGTAKICKDADIVVVATGKSGTLTKDMVNNDHVILDVGINWDEEANKIVGDVSFEEVEPYVEAITPTPGGVGSVTTAILCKHVVEAAERALSS